MQSMKWDFMTPRIFPKYVYTLCGDSAWNFNAEGGWYRRQGGTLLAWMEIAELTLYSLLLRRKSWCWAGCNSGARALAGQRKRHAVKQCLRLQASMFVAFTHRRAIETRAESHKPELPHNKNVYQEMELAEQAESGVPWHTGALFLFQHNSALFPSALVADDRP